MSNGRLLDLWTRYAAGEALAAAEQRELLRGLEQNDELRRQVLRNDQIDGLLHGLAPSASDADAFVRAFEGRLAADGDGTRFVKKVAPLLAKTIRRRPFRQTGFQSPWFFALAAAGLFMGVLLLVALPPDAPPERIARPSKPAPKSLPLPERTEPRPAPLPEATAKPTPLPPNRPDTPVPPPPAPPEPRTIVQEEPKKVASPKTSEPVPPPKPAPPTVAEPPAVVMAKVLDARNAFAMDGNRRSELARGGEIKAGQDLEVGAGGRLVIGYPDSSRVEIGPDTLVREVAEGPGRWMFVEKGSLLADVAKQPKDRLMAVASPAGEAVALGTRFRIMVDGIPKPRMHLEVTKGLVRLKDLAGKTVDVPSGHFAVAASGTELTARLLPVEDVLLTARDVKVTGGGWQIVKDEAAVSGEALEAAREKAFSYSGVKYSAVAPHLFVEFSFLAEANRDYHVWVRGRTLADPGRPLLERTASDSVALETVGGRWSRECKWLPRSGFPALHAFDGYRQRDGYWWIGGNSELPTGIGDEVPVALRFAKPGRQTLRLYPLETPMRIDAIWISTTRKTRPDSGSRGPVEDRK